MAKKIKEKDWKLGIGAYASWNDGEILCIYRGGNEIWLTRAQMRRLYVGLKSMYRD